jgi:hypothetical protein
MNILYFSLLAILAAAPTSDSELVPITQQRGKQLYPFRPSQPIIHQGGNQLSRLYPNRKFADEEDDDDTISSQESIKAPAPVLASPIATVTHASKSLQSLIDAASKRKKVNEEVEDDRKSPARVDSINKEDEGDDDIRSKKRVKGPYILKRLHPLSSIEDVYQEWAFGKMWSTPLRDIDVSTRERWLADQQLRLEYRIRKIIGELIDEKIRNAPGTGNAIIASLQAKMEARNPPTVHAYALALEYSELKRTYGETASDKLSYSWPKGGSVSISAKTAFAARIPKRAAPSKEIRSVQAKASRSSRPIASVKPRGSRVSKIERPQPPNLIHLEYPVRSTKVSDVWIVWKKDLRDLDPWHKKMLAGGLLKQEWGNRGWDGKWATKYRYYREIGEFIDQRRRENPNQSTKEIIAWLDGKSRLYITL